MKIVYFSPDSDTTAGVHPFSSPLMGGGRLHFRKFETSKMEQCLKFVEQKRLHLGAEGGKAVVKATGGGAFKYGRTLPKNKKVYRATGCVACNSYVAKTHFCA